MSYKTRLHIDKEGNAPSIGTFGADVTVVQTDGPVVEVEE